jgi:hypothetical protein
VGQVLRLDPEPRSDTRRGGEPTLEARAFTVVGVAKDVPGFRMAPLPKAVVYLPVNAAIPGTSLAVRVHGDADLAKQRLVDRFTAIGAASGEVIPMRSLVRLQVYFLQLGFWSTVALGGLALALTLSGLFSVLSYLVELRTREIGVRMALGATSRDVTRLVLSQSIRPVGVGLVLGGGAAAGLSMLVLKILGAGTLSQFVQILDPVAYAASLFIILAACLAASSIPAVRAAGLDPMVTLRQD